MAQSRESGNPRIFVCYRRVDTSAVAGRLSDFLRTEYGEQQVFLDIDQIAPGDDFRETIKGAMRATEVVLVLIGESFSPEKLSSADDFIRVELEAALAANRLVIPVLVDDARMPTTAELPESLRPFAYRNAATVRLRHFRLDIEHLISRINERDWNEALSARTPDGLSEAISRPRSLIFVSYAHSDLYWLGRVQVHLKPLTRYGRLELWDDTQIQVGDEWRAEIRKAMDLSIAAILLVSADFMASDFIFNDELPPLLESARSRGVKILPIVASSSHFAHSELAKVQALNPPGSPLDLMTKGEQEATLARLFTSIRPLVGN